MTETEQTLWRALVELDSAVKLLPAASQKPDLLPLFARIDGLSRQLPRDTPPDLLHYLRRKSYEKARLWLEGKEAERGACRK